MTNPEPQLHAIAARRKARGWSQAQLALHSGTPRSSISAIESGRLTPSVDTALAVARVLECPVEELFGGVSGVPASTAPTWAWLPGTTPARYWSADVGARRLLYPVEPLSVSTLAHDGVWQEKAHPVQASELAARTLVLACCDPAAGLLAAEYAQASGYRLLVLSRGSAAALELLRHGLVHMAGLHRATTGQPELNAQTIRSSLGNEFRLLHAARWEAGIVLPADDRTRSAERLMQRSRRWALREPGSTARQYLDELSEGRRLAGKVVTSHNGVAQAIQAGWANAGLGIKLVAQETGARFLPLRTEVLDFCFPAALSPDPRLQAFIRVLGSHAHRRRVGELPGYDARNTGEICSV